MRKDPAQGMKGWREGVNEPRTLDTASAFFWMQKNSFITTDFPKVIDRSKQNCHFSILSYG